MKILLTGMAGFIGSHTFINFTGAGHEVVGVDNMNDYNPVRLKLDRLAACGFNTEGIDSGKFLSDGKGNRFKKLELADSAAVAELFASEKFDMVCHLAAQAGVRYSVENPYAYISSNISAFLNILEGCRHNNVKHLVYSSSSSVYGDGNPVPFSTKSDTDHPVSLYAATKKSDELMAYCYTSLYRFPTTGLRFFTVYGPWGREDMALFKFTKAIFTGKEIDVYNNGELARDFTYIDDIVKGVHAALVSAPAPDSARIYNIGHGSPVKLMDFIRAIEAATGKHARTRFLPFQKGDVHITYADIADLIRDFGYKPSVSVDEGVRKYVDWFRQYYQF